MRSYYALHASLFTAEFAHQPRHCAGKSGADPEKVAQVVKEIKEKCSRLNVTGLMTIGRFDEHPEVDFRV